MECRTVINTVAFLGAGPAEHIGSNSKYEAQPTSKSSFPRPSSFRYRNGPTPFQTLSVELSLHSKQRQDEPIETAVEIA
ncbi:unnamed protein product [Dovyalis caffra]|uniref:Uncharacterized protein n=1 Tax=Dovyalis caffra TaxID=77055 RepID=A0AAV1STA7_9ROSI|nr:unnamed protein product [Dovyalis caffra]